MAVAEFHKMPVRRASRRTLPRVLGVNRHKVPAGYRAGRGMMEFRNRRPTEGKLTFHQVVQDAVDLATD